MGSVILFISGSEIVVVMLVVLILFGSKSIPGMARTFGKGMKEFRNVTQDLKNELETSTEDFRKNIDDVKDTVQEGTRKITDDVKKVSDNVAMKTKEMTDEVGKEINNTASAKKQKKEKTIPDKTVVENKKESVYDDIENPEEEVNTTEEKTSDTQKADKTTSLDSKKNVEQVYGSDFE